MRLERLPLLILALVSCACAAGAAAPPALPEPFDPDLVLWVAPDGEIGRAHV